MVPTCLDPTGTTGCWQAASQPRGPSDGPFTPPPARGPRLSHAPPRSTVPTRAWPLPAPLQALRDPLFLRSAPSHQAACAGAGPRGAPHGPGAGPARPPRPAPPRPASPLPLRHGTARRGPAAPGEPGTGQTGTGRGGPGRSGRGQPDPTGTPTGTPTGERARPRGAGAGWGGGPGGAAGSLSRGAGRVPISSRPRGTLGSLSGGGGRVPIPAPRRRLGGAGQGRGAAGDGARCPGGGSRQDLSPCRRQLGFTSCLWCLGRGLVRPILCRQHPSSSGPKGPCPTHSCGGAPGPSPNRSR